MKSELFTIAPKGWDAARFRDMLRQTVGWELFASTLDELNTWTPKDPSTPDEKERIRITIEVLESSDVGG